MKIFARQGDLVIAEDDSAIEAHNYIEAVSPILAGSKSSPHTLDGPVKIAREEAGTYIVVPVATTLNHAGRHKPLALPKGRYRVSSLRERGDKTDRKVED